MAYFEVNKKPPISFPTVSGAVCTFNSQYAGLPLKAHEVAVVATQSGSGTPSPSNPRAISGVDSIHIQNTAGINQWDEQWEVGGINANTGANANFNDRIRCKNYIYVNGLDSIGIYVSTQYLTVVFYDINRQYISGAQGGSAVRSVPNNAYFMRFSLGSDYGTTYNHDFSVNYPSTDTNYHAFEGQSATVQVGSSIYTGTYNAITGEFTADHLLNSITVMQQAVSGLFFFDITNGIASSNMLCNMAEFGAIVTSHAQASSYPKQVCLQQQSATNLRVLYYNADYTYEDWQTFISNNPFVVCVEVQPTTIQLTPIQLETLLENNIWADTGDTTLQYIKLG